MSNFTNSLVLLELHENLLTNAIVATVIFGGVLLCGFVLKIIPSPAQDGSWTSWHTSGYPYLDGEGGKHSLRHGQIQEAEEEVMLEQLLEFYEREAMKTARESIVSKPKKKEPPHRKHENSVEEAKGARASPSRRIRPEEEGWHRGNEMGVEQRPPYHREGRGEEDEEPREAGSRERKKKNEDEAVVGGEIHYSTPRRSLRKRATPSGSVWAFCLLCGFSWMPTLCTFAMVGPWACYAWTGGGRRIAAPSSILTPDVVATMEERANTYFHWSLGCIIASGICLVFIGMAWVLAARPPSTSSPPVRSLRSSASAMPLYVAIPSPSSAFGMAPLDAAWKTPRSIRKDVLCWRPEAREREEEEEEEEVPPYLERILPQDRRRVFPSCPSSCGSSRRTPRPFRSFPLSSHRPPDPFLDSSPPLSFSSSLSAASPLQGMQADTVPLSFSPPSLSSAYPFSVSRKKKSEKEEKEEEWRIGIREAHHDRRPHGSRREPGATGEISHQEEIRSLSAKTFLSEAAVAVAPYQSVIPVCFYPSVEDEMEKGNEKEQEKKKKEVGRRKDRSPALMKQDSEGKPEKRTERGHGHSVERRRTSSGRRINNAKATRRSPPSHTGRHLPSSTVVQSRSMTSSASGFSCWSSTPVPPQGGQKRFLYYSPAVALLPKELRPQACHYVNHHHYDD